MMIFTYVAIAGCPIPVGTQTTNRTRGYDMDKKKIRDIVSVRDFEELNVLMPNSFEGFEDIDEAIQAVDKEAQRRLDLKKALQEAKALHGLPKCELKEVKEVKEVPKDEHSIRKD